MKLILVLMQLAWLHTAQAAISEESIDRIQAGAYISTVSQDNACSVVIKNEATVFSKDRYSIQLVAQTYPIPKYGDLTLSHVESDVFSMEALKSQIRENGGEFSLVTRQSLTTEHTIKGRLYEADRSLYLEVSVIHRTCIGFCADRSSGCTIRLKSE